MIAKRQELHGTVQQADINIAFDGSTTDTAKVTVDNDAREIRVDVITTGILGETSDKAYPGNLGAQTRRLMYNVSDRLDIETQRALQAEGQIQNSVDLSVEAAAENDATLLKNINDIRKTYASTDYVIQKINEASSFTNITQIIDAIDFENCTVTVKGEVQLAQIGVVYLLRDPEELDETAYLQYTLIDDELVSLGSTKVELDGYATKEFVEDRIEAIPPPDLSNYATKYYVQTELYKLNSATTQIVDSVDIENNTVIINGEVVLPDPTVIYLVKNEGNVYQQYVLIDGVLTNVGSTEVDLANYATKEFVAEEITKASNDLVALLQNIKFIDGGNAPV